MSSFSKKRVLEILDQAQEGDNFSKLIDRCLQKVWIAWFDLRLRSELKPPTRGL